MGLMQRDHELTLRRIEVRKPCFDSLLDECGDIFVLVHTPRAEGERRNLATVDECQ